MIASSLMDVPHAHLVTHTHSAVSLLRLLTIFVISAFTAISCFPLLLLPRVWIELKLINLSR